VVVGGGSVGDWGVFICCFLFGCVGVVSFGFFVWFVIVGGVLVAWSIL